MLQFKKALPEQRSRLKVKLPTVQGKQTLCIFMREIKLPNKSGRVLIE